MEIHKRFIVGKKLLLHNGTIKCVEELEIGDSLIGVNDLPAKITGLFGGKEMLYEVQYGPDDQFIATGDTLLLLKYLNDGKRHNIELSIEKLMKLSKEDFDKFKGFYVNDKNKYKLVNINIKEIGKREYVGIELDSYEFFSGNVH